MLTYNMAKRGRATARAAAAAAASATAAAFGCCCSRWGVCRGRTPLWNLLGASGPVLLSTKNPKGSKKWV